MSNFSLWVYTASGFAREINWPSSATTGPSGFWAEVAVQCLGGAPAGIYQDSILTEVAYVIDHADAVFVVAEDQEQTDKILDMKDDLPKVRKVIYTDPKGMRDYDDPLLMFWPDVEEIGRGYDRDNPGFFEEMAKSVAEEDVALIAYTSGTTGKPKGSLLTHRNMLAMARNLCQVDAKYESDEFVSFLPLPWIGEQMMAVGSSLAFGFTVNFPEEPDTVDLDKYEIGPNVMFSPPRVWEGLSRAVMVKHMDASRFKRLVYNLCMPIGYKVADFKFEKKTIPIGWKILYGLAWLCLFRALKDRLGFSRIRSATTGGAALGPDVFRFFHALGGEPEADLRADRDIRHLLHPYRRRHRRQYRGHAHSGDRAQNRPAGPRGRGRDRLPQPGPFYRLL